MLKSCPFWKATQIMEFKKCHTLQSICTIHLKVEKIIVDIHNYKPCKICYLFGIQVFEHLKIAQISGCSKGVTVVPYHRNVWRNCKLQGGISHEPYTYVINFKFTEVIGNTIIY